MVTQLSMPGVFFKDVAYLLRYLPRPRLGSAIRQAREEDGIPLVFGGEETRGPR